MNFTNFSISGLNVTV